MVSPKLATDFGFCPRTDTQFSVNCLLVSVGDN